jgi:ankyrin repeat protein
MLDKSKLAVLIEKYRSHPQFLGIEVLDVNQSGALDDTLLHIAAQTGATDDIRTLISCGARVDAIGDLGNTPLHQAAMMGQTDSVATLLELGARADLRNEFNETALQVAELGDHHEAARLLRDYRPK